MTGESRGTLSPWPGMANVEPLCHPTPAHGEQEGRDVCHNSRERSPPQGLLSYCGAFGVNLVQFTRPRSLLRVQVWGEVAETQQFGLPTSDTVGPQTSTLLGGRGVAGCRYLLWGQTSKKWGRAALLCPRGAPPQAVHGARLLAAHQERQRWRQWQ